MIQSYNEFSKLQITCPNSWTLQDLENFVDAQPEGFFWFYITGPATKTITSSAVTAWSIVSVFKRNNTLTLCEIHPAQTSLPILALRKDNGIWDESFSIRGGGNICSTYAASVKGGGVNVGNERIKSSSTDSGTGVGVFDIRGVFRLCTKSSDLSAFYLNVGSYSGESDRAGRAAAYRDRLQVYANNEQLDNCDTFRVAKRDVEKVHSKCTRRLERMGTVLTPLKGVAA